MAIKFLKKKIDIYKSYNIIGKHRLASISYPIDTIPLSQYVHPPLILIVGIDFNHKNRVIIKIYFHLIFVELANGI